MKKQHGFTLIELLVVILIIAVLMGLLFPAIGAAKRIARRAKNGTNVRSIIQAMTVFSESHRGFFPGFDGFEFIGADYDSDQVIDEDGQNVQARYWHLLDGGYLDGDAMVSPAEARDAWPNADAATALDQFKVTTENYSFAMLKIAGSNAPGLAGANSRDRFRREEWRNEQNARAPIISDRLAMEPGGDRVKAASDPDTYLSIHDGSSLGTWVGSIGYGDLTVEFSNEPIVATRIAALDNAEDDIFAQRDTGLAGVDLDKNAAMVYEDFDIITAPVQ